MYSTNPGMLVSSSNIKDYGLKVTDQDTQRRNFDGYTKEMEYTYADMQMGQDSAGTTDTDAKTHTGYEDKGYSRIYKKY